MISDTLFEVRGEIRSYLDRFPEMYASVRPQIEDLLTRIEALQALLDMPPGLASLATEDKSSVSTPSDPEIDAAARVLSRIGLQHGWFPADTADFDAMDPIARSEFGGLVVEILRAAVSARSSNPPPAEGTH